MPQFAFGGEELNNEIFKKKKKEQSAQTFSKSNQNHSQHLGKKRDFSSVQRRGFIQAMSGQERVCVLFV